jgi:hypothetical protein
MTESVLPSTIAILGGTGKEGSGLGYRWAAAGYRVLIGSRTPEKAVSAAAAISELLGGAASVEGTSNKEAAQRADISVLTVPYAAHRATLEGLARELEGKLLVDVTVPLVPPKVGTVQMPPAGSAAQEAREILGPGVHICAAFQNISHEHLVGGHAVECDVLVTGTSKEARTQTLQLVAAAGLRGWDAGALENSAVVEGLTSVLIHINRLYGTTNAGIRVTGVPPAS